MLWAWAQLAWPPGADPSEKRQPQQSGERASRRLGLGRESTRGSARPPTPLTGSAAVENNEGPSRAPCPVCPALPSLWHLSATPSTPPSTVPVLCPPTPFESFSLHGSAWGGSHSAGSGRLPRAHLAGRCGSRGPLAVTWPQPGTAGAPRHVWGWTRASVGPSPGAQAPGAHPVASRGCCCAPAPPPRPTVWEVGEEVGEQGGRAGSRWGSRPGPKCSSPSWIYLAGLVPSLLPEPLLPRQADIPGPPFRPRSLAHLPHCCLRSRPGAPACRSHWLPCSAGGSQPIAPSTARTRPHADMGRGPWSPLLARVVASVRQGCEGMLQEAMEGQICPPHDLGQSLTP